MSAGRAVWVKIRSSKAERAEWHAKARSAGLTLSDLMRRSVGRMRPWSVAHADVERERTQQVARIGSGLSVARITVGSGGGAVPVGPFPPPALRTGRADLPHPALQWDHATRTRNASSELLPAIAGHPRYRWLCVPSAPGSCTASPRCPSPTRRQTCSRPDSTGPPIGQPGPFAYACDASELPAPLMRGS